jgi:hypothetical protein
LFVDAILEYRPLRPDFGDGHAVQCVVEAAFRTERTSLGFVAARAVAGAAPRARTQRAWKTEFRGLGRHSHLREAGLKQDPV